MDFLLAMAPPANGQGGGGGVISTLLMGFIVFLILGTLFRSMSGSKIPFLVLRSFKVDPNDPNNEFILIKGRPAGILSWIFTNSKMDEETSLKCTSKKIEIKGSSFWGDNYVLIANNEVASAYCAFQKPMLLLVFGIIIIVFGLITSSSVPSATVVLVLLGIILIVYYVLGKKITIVIETNGGSKYGLSFRRSVIENISIDNEKAMKVVELLNAKVIESQNKY